MSSLERLIQCFFSFSLRLSFDAYFFAPLLHFVTLFPASLPASIFGFGCCYTVHWCGGMPKRWNSLNVYISISPKTEQHMQSCVRKCIWRRRSNHTATDRSNGDGGRRGKRIKNEIYRVHEWDVWTLQKLHISHDDRACINIYPHELLL